MTDFIKLLKKDEEINLFYPFVCGDFLISIQASNSHYCKPRETLEEHEWYCYDKWEIAMLHKEQWVHADNSYLDDFDRQDELDEVYEFGDHPVGAYAPTNLIEDLLGYVESKESSQFERKEFN